MNNFISTNRKEVKFCFSLPNGPNKIVTQENNNILGETLVSLFSCFVNPVKPGVSEKQTCESWKSIKGN